MVIGTISAVAKLDDRMSGQTQDLQRTFARAAGNIAAAGAAIGVAAGTASAAVEAFVSFEGSMNRVAAVMQGATAPEIERLGALALEMGAQTKFSATEAADGMEFLARAGLTAAETMEALPAMLALAAAGSLDLANAADIATNVTAGFSLQVDEMTRVSDVLAQTAASSNTNIEKLGAGMSYAALTASSAGLSLEETSAAIGLMGNVAIPGERAGTGLARAIQKLFVQSGPAAEAMARMGERIGQSTIEVTDGEGKMLPLVEIIGQLEKAGITTSEAMEVFGARGSNAILALTGQGSDALREFTVELENSGGAAGTMADRQLAGLYGALTRLGSAWDTMKVQLGTQFAPAVERVASIFTSLVGFISNNSKALDALTGILAGVFVTGVGIAVAALWTLVPAITAATGGINLIIPLIGLVVAAIITWRDEIAAFLKGVWNAFVSALETITGPLLRVANLFGADLPENLDSWRFATEETTEATVELAATAEDAAGAAQDLAGAAEGAEGAVTGASEAVGALGDTTTAATSSAVSLTGALRDTAEASDRAAAAAERERQVRLRAIAARFEIERELAAHHARVEQATEVNMDRVVEIMSEGWPETLPDPKAMVAGMAEALEPMRRVPLPPPAVKPMIFTVREQVRGYADDVAAAMLREQSMSDALRNAFQSRAVSGAIAFVGDFMSGRLGGILSSGLGQTISGILGGLSGKLGGILGGLKNKISGLLGGGGVGKALGAITGGPVGAAIGGVAGKLAGKAISKVGGAIKSLFGAGDSSKSISRALGARGVVTTGGGEKRYIVGGKLLDDTGRTVGDYVPDTSRRAESPEFAARGGPIRGLTVVGERGAELVDSRTPSRVYSASDLGAALSSGPGRVVRGGPLTVQVMLPDGRVLAETVVEELPRVVDEFGL